MRREHRDGETDRQTDGRGRDWLEKWAILSHPVVTVSTVVIQGSFFPLATWKHQHLLKSFSTDQKCF